MSLMNDPNLGASFMSFKGWTDYWGSYTTLHIKGLEN